MHPKPVCKPVFATVLEVMNSQCQVYSNLLNVIVLMSHGSGCQRAPLPKLDHQ